MIVEYAYLYYHCTYNTPAEVTTVLLYTRPPPTGRARSVLRLVQMRPL